MSTWVASFNLYCNIRKEEELVREYRKIQKDFDHRLIYRVMSKKAIWSTVFNLNTNCKLRIKN